MDASPNDDDASRPGDPIVESFQDPFDDFQAGRITAADCAALWASAVDDPLSNCSEPDWSRNRLKEMTHIGVTWQQFADLLAGMRQAGASKVPQARSIRGTGTWKPNPRLLMFVDLDGVVSPVTVSQTDSRFPPLSTDPMIRASAPPDTGWADWTNETIKFVPVPRTLLDRLAALARRTDLEVAWATTWEENANWLFEDLNMDTRLPVYRFDAATEPATKWSTVVDQYEQRRLPFVWIDDDLGVEEATWARTLDVDTLLIRTNTFHGLTRDCWDHIEAWIAMHIGPSDAAPTAPLEPQD
jgi:hypothetical protein